VVDNGARCCLNKNKMNQQMLNIKDEQPIQGDKILFLTDKHLINGMEFKEVKDGKGIAKSTYNNEEIEFEYWAYTLTINSTT
jgi:hypothetical protein